MAQVNPVPQGLHTITPHLIADGAAEAIDLYKKAFGAEELTRALHPDGKRVWHAALRIGDSSFFINDEFPEMGPSHPTDLWLYSEKADELFKRATEAGFEVIWPMTDQFWGDRSGTVKDRWGNMWTLAKHIKDLTPEEATRAGEEFVKSASPS